MKEYQLGLNSIHDFACMDAMQEQIEELMENMENDYDRLNDRLIYWKGNTEITIDTVDHYRYTIAAPKHFNISYLISDLEDVISDDSFIEYELLEGC